MLGDVDNIASKDKGTEHVLYLKICTKYMALPESGIQPVANELELTDDQLRATVESLGIRLTSFGW